MDEPNYKLKAYDLILKCLSEVVGEKIELGEYPQFEQELPLYYIVPPGLKCSLVEIQSLCEKLSVIIGSNIYIINTDGIEDIWLFNQNAFINYFQKNSQDQTQVVFSVEG